MNLVSLLSKLMNNMKITTSTWSWICNSSNLWTSSPSINLFAPHLKLIFSRIFAGRIRLMSSTPLELPKSPIKVLLGISLWSLLQILINSLKKLLSWCYLNPNKMLCMVLISALKNNGSNLLINIPLSLTQAQDTLKNLHLPNNTKKILKNGVQKWINQELQSPTMKSNK